MTLDWIRLATASTKGHFCSVLISNIYWLTSLSTDSTITFSYLRSFLKPLLLFIIHYISLQRDALSCGSFFWKFLRVCLGSQAFLNFLRFQHFSAQFIFLLLFLLLAFSYLIVAFGTCSIGFSTCFVSLALASRIHVRSFPFAFVPSAFLSRFQSSLCLFG